MKEIPLTRGAVALVDDDDYEWLTQWKWYCRVGHTGTLYASRHMTGIKMHRVITDAPKGTIVDHIDGDGLNNQRGNLRICTHAENCRNQRKTHGSSVYKGVFWLTRRGIWVASITFNCKRIFLGHFANEIDAARAYDQRARELFGEYARPNFEERS